MDSDNNLERSSKLSHRKGSFAHLITFPYDEDQLCCTSSMHTMGFSPSYDNNSERSSELSHREGGTTSFASFSYDIFPVKPKTPEHIVLEWELLNLIISYIGITFPNIISPDITSQDITSPDITGRTKFSPYRERRSLSCITSPDNVSFTTHEIKKYYSEINLESFNKIYGKEGIRCLLLFRNGVTYDKEEGVWYICPNPFLNGLLEEYKKDEDMYGKDFDKPWIKNLGYLD